MSDTASDGPAPGAVPRPPVPRWVKVSALIGLLILLLVLVLMLSGNGRHGPGRHMGLDRRQVPAATR